MAVASGLQAFGLVIAPAVVSLGAAAGLRLLQRSLRREARLAQAALRGEGTPVAGKVALAGTVELLDGEREPPVKVVRDSERWRVEGRPFLLRLASGARVLVKPGARPQLRGALDPEGQRAELIDGEQVFVRGVLRGGLSADPHAARPVVSATWWWPLRLSTEPFTGALEERASSLDFELTMLLLTAVGSQLVYAGYYFELLFGSRPATIVLALYFWVALTASSMVLGGLWSGLKSARPDAQSRHRLG